MLDSVPDASLGLKRFGGKKFYVLYVTGNFLERILIMATAGGMGPTPGHPIHQLNKVRDAPDSNCGSNTGARVFGVKDPFAAGGDIRERGLLGYSRAT